MLQKQLRILKVNLGVLVYIMEHIIRRFTMIPRDVDYSWDVLALISTRLILHVSCYKISLTPPMTHEHQDISFIFAGFDVLCYHKQSIIRKSSLALSNEL